MEDGAKVEIVDFYADWCSPCKALKTVLDQIESKRDVKVNKVNIETDDGMELARKSDVRSVPTLIVNCNGKSETIVGLVPLEKIEQVIDELSS